MRLLSILRSVGLSMTGPGYSRFGARVFSRWAGHGRDIYVLQETKGEIDV